MPYRLDSKNTLKCRVCFGKRNKKYGVGTHKEGGDVDTFASFEGERKVAQLKVMKIQAIMKVKKSEAHLEPARKS